MLASAFRKAATYAVAASLLWNPSAANADTPGNAKIVLASTTPKPNTTPSPNPKLEEKVVISTQESDAFIKAMFDTVAVVNNKPASWNKDNGEVSDGFIESAKGIMRVFKDQGRVPAGKYYSTANGDKLETPNSAGYAFDITTPADAATLIVAGTQIRQKAPNIYDALRFLTASPVAYSVGERRANAAFVDAVTGKATEIDAMNAAVDAAASGWTDYTTKNPIRPDPAVAAAGTTTAAVTFTPK